MMRMNIQVIEHIENIAGKLTRKYGTRDPYELADWLDCIVDFEDYPKLQGFCNIILGVRVIGLNGRSDYYTRRCACAHELGHLTLGHVRQAGFQPGHMSDFSNLTARFEAEANCFAASLLMSDADTLEAIRTYDEPTRAAASIYVCPELFQAKVRILNSKGYRLNVPELPRGSEWKLQSLRALS